MTLDEAQADIGDILRDVSVLDDHLTSAERDFRENLAEAEHMAQAVLDTIQVIRKTLKGTR